jgi:hypothetical protein
LLTLCVAGCSPRVDRLDVYSGSSQTLPQDPASPRAGEPVTVRIEISARRATVETPMVTLQRLWAVAPITSDGAPATAISFVPRIPMTPVHGGTSTPSIAYAMTLTPGGSPSLPYGSTWLMNLRVPYRSGLRSSELEERLQFTVRAPASCAAFDEGIDGWSVLEDRISYGATLDDIHRWPQDTQTRFLTRVALESDRQVNYPETFEAAEIPLGSARFKIGGDQPERFREWLVRNPYISDKNHWIAQVKTPPLSAESFSIQVMTDAEHPLRLRARADCAVPGANKLPCTPDSTDSAEVTLAPGPQWRTVRLPIGTKKFPEGSTVRIGHLLILGEPADAEKRVWIDMACQ